MFSTNKIAGIASLLTIFGLGTANAADVLVPPPAPAPNANTITLKVSGQVNKSVLYADNGPNDELFIATDNDNTGTRFRFVASGRLNEDVTAGATIELQYESNTTANVDFGNNGGTGGTPIGGGAFGVGERIGEVWFDSATMGKLSLGQGNTASNGTSEVDLSGTGIASYSLAGGGQGGLTFAGTSITVGSAATNLDGGSRRDRIRYDTPTFAGFRASASASQGGRYDAALRYANQFAGARIAAAIAYQNTNASNTPLAARRAVAASGGLPAITARFFDANVFGTNAETDRINGSISVLLDNGFNLTFAAANANRENGSDRSFYYGKAGFRTNSISMYGRTSFSIDYYESEDMAASNSGTAKAYGFAAVQNLDPIGASVYFSVKNLEQEGATNDIFAAFVGSRIRF